MLAVLFHSLLGGSPAWRVNLLSVVLASLGAYLHFLTIVRWDYWLAFDPSPAGAAARRLRLRRRGRWLPWEWSEGVCGAVVGTGLLSFCPLIWTYSTQAEVRARGRTPTASCPVLERGSARVHARGRCEAVAAPAGPRWPPARRPAGGRDRGDARGRARDAGPRRCSP